MIVRELYCKIVSLLFHRRSVEISLALRRTFEAAVLTELFPQSMIDVYVQVLQSDGGKFNKTHSLTYQIFVVYTYQVRT